MGLEPSRRIFPGPICLIIAVGLIGCSEEIHWSQGVMVRDSAGIRIIENALPAWEEGQGWTLDSTSLVEIGADPDDPNSQAKNPNERKD